jgi:hypothetical protein
VGAARRLIVEVRSGPLRGKKAVVAPGATLRVGRTDRADLRIERDRELSRAHFELTWDGATCLLHDLGSARGTQLAGRTIAGETVLRHGAWIQAGETSFGVYIEAWSSPAGEPPQPDLAERAFAALAPRRRTEVGARAAGTGVRRLYAVLDAARSSRVIQLLHESVDETRSLYEGVEGEALANVAPYMVGFEEDSGLLDRLLREGWGQSWGVFVESPVSFELLRRHFRRFLMVEEEETGGRMYFRFYDPRVLREFLPLATTRQRDEIFADVIESFLLEDEHGGLCTFAAATTSLYRDVGSRPPIPAPASDRHAQDP